MNLLQRATLWVGGGAGLQAKRVGNQVGLVSSGRDGLPILQPYSLVSALERDMKQNPFLYSAMRKKADAIASVPFYVEEFIDGEWVRIVNHPAEHLVEGANPFISGYELKKLLVYHKELVGSSYMQIVSVEGKPVFLQPLYPQHVKVIPSEIDFVRGFEYQIGGSQKKMLKPRDVFWTKHTDPADPYRGLSPLEAIAGEVQTDLEARRWNKISLANRGAADVAFIMRDVVTPDDYELARTMVEDRISGPDNARRPWILGGDSDVRPMSYTAVEMDYINTRKFNREVISAALGVPAPLIGDADNSTYNNLDTLKTDFWQDTITNWLEELRQDLTRQILIPHYGDGRRTRAPALRYMYDLSNVEALQTHIKVKADIAKTLHEAGFKLSDINRKLELGFTVTPEMDNPEPPPPAVPPEPDPGLDEGAVTRMVEVALLAKDQPELFTRAMNSVSGYLGVPSHYPESRFGAYRERGLDAESIALEEIKLCRP